jgi:hypothetical protein
VRQLTKAGCKKVLCEVASGAKTDRAQLRAGCLASLRQAMVTRTRLIRLARSAPDRLNAIVAKQTGFRSPGDTRADITTSHGLPMLTVPGGLAESEHNLTRARTTDCQGRQSGRREDGPQAQTHPAPTAGRAGAAITSVR